MPGSPGNDEYCESCGRTFEELPYRARPVAEPDRRLTESDWIFIGGFVLLVVVGALIVVAVFGGTR